MSYLDRLKEHLGENHPPSQPPKPPKPGLSGFGGSPDEGISPVQALKLCQGELAALDPAKPLHGLDPARWRQLVEDAGWLLDGFAPAAFRNGWTIADLFGLWWYADVPGAGKLTLKDAWGGIADRLQGARSLVMDADRARWRRMFTREPDQYARGTYPNLRPLWEPSE